MGCLTLHSVEDFIKERYYIANRYKRKLEKYNIKFQESNSNRSTYNVFAIIFETPIFRELVNEELALDNIQTKVYYKPLHKMKFYESLNFLPRTEHLFSRILCLPMYNGLMPSSINHICSLIKKVLDGRT